MFPQQYKAGIKAYKTGFLAGVLIGVVICLVLRKAIFSLPLILGLLIAAIAFHLKMKSP